MVFPEPIPPPEAPPPEQGPGGVTIRIPFVNQALQEIAVDVRDPVQAIHDAINLSTYGATSNLPTLYDLIQDFVGVFDLAGDFLQDVRDAVAATISALTGLPTAEDFRQLSGWVGRFATQTTDGLGELHGLLEDVGVDAYNYAAQLTTDLGNQVNNDVAIIDNDIAELWRKIETLPQALPEIPSFDPAEIERRLADLEQQLADLPNTLPATIVETITNNVPAVVTVLAPAITFLIGLATGPDLGPRLDALQQQADDNADCCAAATGRLNDAQPDLSNLAKLRNLLGWLSKFDEAALLAALALLFAEGPGAVIDRLEGVISGPGAAVERQLTDWLGEPPP